MTRQCLVGWRRQFARHGVDAVAFGYPSREPFADNTKRLAAFIATQRAPHIYLLGHSLGGLLILALAAHAGASPAIRRAVIAGSPVGGSMAARRFARWRYGRWMIAGAVPVQGETDDKGWRNLRPPFEVGVIAGSRPLGLGRLFGPIPEPHDGTVQVAETRFPAARDSITMNLSHSEMLLSTRVVEQSLGFFQSGSFVHAGRAG
jgi:pimeloyl-ACP methyl ester carboxylesterase